MTTSMRWSLESAAGKAVVPQEELEPSDVELLANFLVKRSKDGQLSSYTAAANKRASVAYEELTGLRGRVERRSTRRMSIMGNARAVAAMAAGRRQSIVGAFIPSRKSSYVKMQQERFRKFDNVWGDIRSMLYRNQKWESEHEILQPNVWTPGNVEKDKTKFYVVDIAEHGKVKIDLQAIDGDSDLYVSNKFEYPGKEEYTWKSAGEGSDFVEVDFSDTSMPLGPLFIGVYGFSDSEFKICVKARNHSVLPLNKPIQGTVAENQAKFFRFLFPPREESVTITLKVLDGDADLAVDNKLKYPTKTGAKWISAADGDDEITVSTKDRGFTQGAYYVGVWGFCESQFVIRMRVNPRADERRGVHRVYRYLQEEEAEAAAPEEAEEDRDLKAALVQGGRAAEREIDASIQSGQLPLPGFPAAGQEPPDARAPNPIFRPAPGNVMRRPLTGQANAFALRLKSELQTARSTGEAPAGLQQLVTPRAPEGELRGDTARAHLRLGTELSATATLRAVLQETRAGAAIALERAGDEGGPAAGDSPARRPALPPPADGPGGAAPTPAPPAATPTAGRAGGPPLALAPLASAGATPEPRPQTAGGMGDSLSLFLSPSRAASAASTRPAARSATPSGLPESPLRGGRAASAGAGRGRPADFLPLHAQPLRSLAAALGASAAPPAAQPPPSPRGTPQPEGPGGRARSAVEGVAMLGELMAASLAAARPASSPAQRPGPRPPPGPAPEGEGVPPEELAALYRHYYASDGSRRGGPRRPLAASAKAPDGAARLRPQLPQAAAELEPRRAQSASPRPPPGPPLPPAPPASYGMHPRVRPSPRYTATPPAGPSSRPASGAPTRSASLQAATPVPPAGPRPGTAPAAGGRGRGPPSKPGTVLEVASKLVRLEAEIAASLSARLGPDALRPAPGP